VADHTHQFAAHSKVMQLDPAPRQHPHDAQQPEPRCRDSTGDITLPGG
jgi:hypothetical protein